MSQAYTDEDVPGTVEIADLPEISGAVVLTLYTMAEVECQECSITIKVRDDQKGVKRAERFIAKHKEHGGNVDEKGAT